MSKGLYSAGALFHVVVIQRVSGVIEMTIPALYIEVNRKAVLFNSLVDYFISYPDKSMSWKRGVARSVGLFYDFCQVYKKRYKVQIDGFHRHLIKLFASCLKQGTINKDEKIDRLGLYWPICSNRKVKQLVSDLSKFSEWCISECLSERKVSNSGLPRDEASVIAFLFQAKQAKSFMNLSHIVKASELAKSFSEKKKRQIVELYSVSNKNYDAKIFPSDLIDPLLKYGFVLNEMASKPEEREDITAKMITLLLLFGGLRISEPYHLWFSDVVPQVDLSCKVFLRHPSDAHTYIIGEKNKLRSVYLNERGLYPRNHSNCSKSYRAGWKNLKVDSTLSAPVFFIHNAAERLFREMYIYYLNYRERLMKIYLSDGNPCHPFLFVKKNGQSAGAPYSIRAYEGALKRAFRRIEKITGESIKYNKEQGTTPHGMRHSYGQELSDLGVPAKIIQQCLKHRSILSQGVYTEPRYENVSKILSKMRDKVAEGESTFLSLQVVESMEIEASQYI